MALTGMPVIGMATPAAASTTYAVTITLSGTTCDANTTVTSSASSLVVATGDIIDLTYTNNVSSGGAVVECGIALTPSMGGNLLGWVSDPNGFPSDLSGLTGTGNTATISTPRLLSFRVGTVPTAVHVLAPVFSVFNSILTITFADPTADSTQGGPPDLLQQFALTSDEDCTPVPETIDLFNVPREGGWSKSWAQWANDGAGGIICTREVRYDSATGAWVPRTS